jgi:hypothetical protein
LDCAGKRSATALSGAPTVSNFQPSRADESAVASDLPPQSTMPDSGQRFDQVAQLPVHQRRVAEGLANLGADGVAEAFAEVSLALRRRRA